MRNSNEQNRTTAYYIDETSDYERLVPFFVANDLEFPEEEDYEVPTDLVQCWKVTEGGSAEPAEDSEAYRAGSEQDGGNATARHRLIGGFVLAKRQGEFIVDGIAVDPAYRGAKIGKALLDLGISETLSRGGSRIFLVARAPGFFRKSGFVTVPREEAPNFFECLTCPQYGVDCHPEVMRLDLEEETAK